MPQHIFDILTGFIGHLCKKSEGRNINKGFFVKGTDIAGKHSAADCDFRCLSHIFRNIQALRKIVCAACRNIPDRAASNTLHNAGHHLIQCAISAAAYHEVIFCRSVCRKLHGFPCILSRSCCHDIACLNECINDIQQIIPDLSFSRPGIINKKKLFVVHPFPPFCFFILVSPLRSRKVYLLL